MPSLIFTGASLIAISNRTLDVRISQARYQEMRYPEVGILETVFASTSLMVVLFPFTIQTRVQISASDPLTQMPLGSCFRSERHRISLNPRWNNSLLSLRRSRHVS